MSAGPAHSCANVSRRLHVDSSLGAGTETGAGTQPFPAGTRLGDEPEILQRPGQGSTAAGSRSTKLRLFVRGDADRAGARSSERRDHADNLGVETT